MIAPILAALLALFPATAAEPASIQGVVFRAGSDEPIRDARVILKSKAVKGANVSDVTVRTDSQGQFRFDGLNAGSFRIEFIAEGYARMQYGQRTPTGLEGTSREPNLGALLTVRAGERISGLIARLTPTGSIGGRVRDAGGKPVVDAAVFLLRAVYTATGSRSLLQVGQTETNDRGEYRLWWITPGRYYLAFGYPVDAFEATKSYWLNLLPDVPVRFFPGTSELETARLVVVDPASELTNLDMVVDAGMLRDIRGRVTPPSLPGERFTGSTATGHLQSWQVNIDYVSAGQLLNLRLGDNYNDADGAFEFQGVPPGTYLLLAPGGTPVRVTVTDADVEGVVLTSAPSVSVPVRFTVEGSSSSTSGNWASLTLESVIERGPASAERRSKPEPSEDGRPLRFEVPAGDYRLLFSQRPPSGLYLKEATYRDQDALREVLHISDKPAGEIKVVLGSKPGQVAGSVVDSDKRPAAGRTVALIPTERKERRDLVRSIATDENGNFIFPDVVPGNYRLFAWEEIEPYSWFDPDVIARFATGGVAVQVGESSTETVRLQLITSSAP